MAAIEGGGIEPLRRGLPALIKPGQPGSDLGYGGRDGGVERRRRPRAGTLERRLHARRGLCFDVHFEDSPQIRFAPRI